VKCEIYSTLCASTPDVPKLPAPFALWMQELRSEAINWNLGLWSLKCSEKKIGSSKEKYGLVVKYIPADCR
jgi:hypothetical protein